MYKVSKEREPHFSKFHSVKVKKILRKYQTPFRKKLRRLKLRQYHDFSYRVHTEPGELGKIAHFKEKSGKTWNARVVL